MIYDGKNLFVSDIYTNSPIGADGGGDHRTHMNPCFSPEIIYNSVI